MALKPKPNHQNESIQKIQDRKNHIKFGMWRFSPLFSSITVAWCIMNSCHKVVRLIRNTTFKLCTDCEKKFVRNAQNCGNGNLAIMAQPVHWTGLASADFFLYPTQKTPIKGKHFATIEEIKEKSKQELFSITKTAFHKCFEDWKIRCHNCIISEGGNIEGDKIFIYK